MTTPLHEPIEADQFLQARTPFEIFSDWLDEAKKTSLQAPESFVLSTSTNENWPNSRVLLLKEIRADGLVFYTNYESDKGRELKANPKAVMNFFWDPLWRQVKWQGLAEKISHQESEKYWATRPRQSQLSQWVSRQSQPVQNREHMERLLQEAERQFHGQEVPCPAHWGGYLLRPTYVEFWIGRDGRFHDRYAYRKVENRWRGQRLYP